MTLTKHNIKSPCPAGDVAWEGMGGSLVGFQFKKINDQVSLYVLA